MYIDKDCSHKKINWALCQNVLCKIIVVGVSSWKEVQNIIRYYSRDYLFRIVGGSTSPRFSKERERERERDHKLVRDAPHTESDWIMHIFMRIYDFTTSFQSHFTVLSLLRGHTIFLRADCSVSWPGHRTPTKNQPKSTPACPAFGDGKTGIIRIHLVTTIIELIHLFINSMVALQFLMIA